jgi:peptide deformylase
MKPKAEIAKGRILQVAQLGHPILRKRAKRVNKVDSPEITQLISDMLATSTDRGAMGLAATQVYATWRIIVVSSHPSPNYPAAPLMKPTVMINPIITWKSDQKKLGWEGCLSIPGIRGEVLRSAKILISFITPTGRKVNMKASNFIARIIQHEVDHLNGINFTDRARGSSLVTDKEYQRIIGAKIKK